MSFHFSVKKTFGTSLLLSTLFLLFSTSLFAAQFTVTEVYDGDTIRAEGHGTEIRVRMAGIDAPEIHKDVREKGQPYGQEAREYLESMILNKHVQITSYGYDRHDLILGTIFLDGKNINLEMARAGLAEVQQQEAPADFLLEPLIEAEKQAQSNQKGIWAQGEGYMSPGEWRQTERARSACAILLYGIYGKTKR